MNSDAGKEAVSVAGALTSMRIDEMVSNLAIGIAEGQVALDEASMKIAKFMGEAQIAFGKKPGTDIPDLISLVELGFTPNFYQFVDTILELKVSVKTSYEQKREVNRTNKNRHEDSYDRNNAYEQQRSMADSGRTSRSSTYGVTSRRGWSRNSYNGRSRYNSNSGITSKAASAVAGSTSAKTKNIAINTVDAKFASKYNYAIEASSTIKTKIVPIPPPEVFEEILRANVERRKEDEQRFIWTQQVKAILPTLATTSYKIHGIDTSGATPVPDLTTILGNYVSGSMPVRPISDTDTVNLAHLESLKNARREAKALIAKYQQLSNEHWAVIDDISGRSLADEAIDTIPENLEKLIVDFEIGAAPPKYDSEGNVVPADPDAVVLSPTEIEAAVQKVQQACVDFNRVIKEIEARYIEKEAENPEPDQAPQADLGIAV